MTWERGEQGVGGFMLSERCGWSGIQFTVILEVSDSCFLREVRRQVARRKNTVITGLTDRASHGKSLTARKNGTEKCPGCTCETQVISGTQSR